MRWSSFVVFAGLSYLYITPAFFNCSESKNRWVISQWEKQNVGKNHDKAKQVWQKWSEVTFLSVQACAREVFVEVIRINVQPWDCGTQWHWARADDKGGWGNMIIWMCKKGREKSARWSAFNRFACHICKTLCHVIVFFAPGNRKLGQWLYNFRYEVAKWVVLTDSLLRYHCNFPINSKLMQVNEIGGVSSTSRETKENSNNATAEISG